MFTNEVQTPDITDSGVDKINGESGSVRSKSHQTVSDYTLRQWFPNNQQSRFLTACGCVEKLVLPSTFWHKSFILDDVKLAVYA